MSTNSESTGKPEEIKYNKKTFPSEGNVYVNIGHELPDEVTVPSGRCLIFVRTARICGGKRLKKGPIVPSSDFRRVILPIQKNRLYVTLPDQPKDVEVIAVFQSKVASTSGDIELQLTPSNPMSAPYPPVKFRYVVD